MVVIHSPRQFTSKTFTVSALRCLKISECTYFFLYFQKIFLKAESEEEIFAHLGLDYIEPWERNA